MVLLCPVFKHWNLSPHSLELHGKVWPAKSSKFLLLCSMMMMMIINFGWTTCVPLKLSVLMRRRCYGQSEGFVRFRIRVYAVSLALRAHLQCSTERMRMRLKQVRIKCHHSLHTNTVMHTLSNSLSSKYSKSNVYMHNSACVFPFFSHNSYNSTTERVSWLPEGPVFVCFLYLLSHLTQWMTDWQLSLDNWLKGKATRSTSSCR